MKTANELAQESTDLERARINDERRAKRVKILLRHIDNVKSRETANKTIFAIQ